MSAEKTKHKFNLVDFIIVIAVIGCIAGVAVRYDFISRFGLDSANDEVEISFLIMNIRNSSYEAFHVGDEFYWKQNSMLVGELTELGDLQQAESYILDENNQYKLGFSELRCDVRGKIRAKGKMTEDGFMLAGTQFLASGKSLLVESQYVSVTFTITDIVKIDTET